MRLLLTLALRNLVSHRMKSLLVGSIMLLGTVLVVLSLVVLDGVEAAMRRSITGSVAGDFQLYDAKAKDPLILLGSSFISVPDIGRIDRYEDLRRVVEAVPGVRAVVPMGFSIGNVATRGALDRSLATLRRAMQEGAPAQEQRQAAASVRAQIAQVALELRTQKEIASDPARLDRQLSDLSAFEGDEMWARLDSDPLGLLEDLDVKIGPLDDGGRQLLFRYMGTDLERFVRFFDGFKIVKGRAVPPQERGFLFSDKFYERRVKHPIARSFDEILERFRDGEAIEPGSEQKSRVDKMARQWRRVTRQLDLEEREEVKVDLQLHLELPGSPSLEALVRAFLTVSDATVEARYRLFYDRIAPHISLYAFAPGDIITVRSYTQTGFLRSVNVTFFGTFSFKGLESSDLAGIYNIMDIVSFRRLLGVMSQAERAELESLKESVGLQDVSSEDAESALFGEAAEVVQPSSFEETSIEPVAEGSFGGAATRGLSDRIEADALGSGLVLNAAVLAQEGAAPQAVRKAVERAVRAAGLELQTTEWRAAAGLIGQFIIVVRVVLYIAMTIIFLVAVVIINNAMVMTTMERITEIGTLRAIGAGRYQVLIMIVIETLLLGALACGIGALIGTSVAVYWGEVGLPAPSRELRFMFGGPRLYPEVGFGHILLSISAVMFVGLISSAYPAWLGASVQPIEAMRSKE